jgi:hypothetical protein
LENSFVKRFIKLKFNSLRYLLSMFSIEKWAQIIFCVQFFKFLQLLNLHLHWNPTSRVLLFSSPYGFTC